MKYIIPAAVVLLLIGAVVIARPDGTSGNEPDANVPSGGSLTAEETAYDFGEISMANGKVSKRFIVRNGSEGSVELEKLYTSCMCTTAELKTENGEKGPFGMPGHASIPRLKETVNPGEEFEVNVVFDPAAHGPAGVGPIARVVTLEYAGGVLEFEFNAMVTP